MISSGQTSYLFGVMRRTFHAAFGAHEKLGRKGRERAPKGPNQFGDAPLVVDVGVEREVLPVWQNAGISLQVFSEEHGIVRFGQPPFDYTAVLDGVDGSYVCENEWGVGRYATLAAILEGQDPTYNDYIVGGAMEHATQRRFIAVRGVGAFVTKIRSGAQIPLNVSSCRELTPDTRIYMDDYTPREKALRRKLVHRIPGIRPSTRCSSINYTDLLLGSADAVVESRKRQDLEKCVFHGLVVMAGGVMITEYGEDLGNARYLAYGHGMDDGPMVIAAATRELAEQIRQLIIRSGV